MKKAPSLFSIGNILTVISDPGGGIRLRNIDGKFYPARPDGMFSIRHRLKLAWMVFTGQADAVIWSGDQ